MITFLPWDSQFFGYNIGFLKSGNLDAKNWEVALRESQELDLTCLYLLADPSDQAAIHLAEDAGFHFMDARLTLEYCNSNNFGQINHIDLANHELRIARSHDLPSLKDIARISHINTRFYSDPNFSRKDCDRLYETWIENSLEGFAQQVFVAENKSSLKAEAYVTCHLSDTMGSIGLIAVHPSAREQQIGYSLLQKAMSWFFENGVSNVEVVTQWNSRPAMNLYKKAGFQLSNLQLWFHKWFRQPESGKMISAQ